MTLNFPNYNRWILKACGVVDTHNFNIPMPIFSLPQIGIRANTRGGRA